MPRIRRCPIAPTLSPSQVMRRGRTGGNACVWQGKTRHRRRCRAEPGEGMGNGRATALLFAREGAKVLAVDRDLASAQETAAMVAKEGGDVRRLRGRRDQGGDAEGRRRRGRASAGAASTSCTTTSASASPAATPTRSRSPRRPSTASSAINLRGTIMACKHVLPIMRKQQSGAIINISSVAALGDQLPARSPTRPPRPA